MSKWIAEFDLEDGDTMPEHMDLEYKGAKLDFHCRPKEPILDKIRAEIEKIPADYTNVTDMELLYRNRVLGILDKYKAETEVDNGNDD